jgi:hypothetical protein
MLTEDVVDSSWTRTTPPFRNIDSQPFHRCFMCPDRSVLSRLTLRHGNAVQCLSFVSRTCVTIEIIDHRVEHNRKNAGVLRTRSGFRSDFGILLATGLPVISGSPAVGTTPRLPTARPSRCFGTGTHPRRSQLPFLRRSCNADTCVVFIASGTPGGNRTAKRECRAVRSGGCLRLARWWAFNVRSTLSIGRHRSIPCGRPDQQRGSGHPEQENLLPQTRTFRHL